MKILLTGITGYLGSHLAKAFVDAGYRVHGLIRKSSSLKRIEEYIDNLELHFIENGLEKAFDIDDPYNSVVHTATCYGRNGESSYDVFKANVDFPLELLEKSVEFNSATFINTDTVLDKCVNAYALSKNNFMEWGRQYAEAGKIKFCNVKMEHMYGPGDDISKFTSYVIDGCVKNVPVIKLTAGEQKRDFIYIDDVISAFLLLNERVVSAEFEEFELGSGREISVRKFVEVVHEVSNSKSLLNFGALEYRDNEVMSSEANISRLVSLGWAPKVGLIDGLKNIIG